MLFFNWKMKGKEERIESGCLYRVGYRKKEQENDSMEGEYNIKIISK